MTLRNHEPAQAQDAALASGYEVERTAIYLRSDGKSLFAWLHRPRGLVSNHGVLICPPIGHEQVHSHRALRHLANGLAAQGFTVLRLDYHGTGDSDGTDKDQHRCATWLTNVGDAVTWLRQSCGSEKVSIVGLRFGATLAALYAENHEVENLVLWAPVVKGQRYMREIKALSLTAKQTAESDESLIEAMGFVSTQETAQDLAQLDLLNHVPRCQHGLIVHSDKGAKPAQLFDHLTKMGILVEQVALPGYEEMMVEPQDTAVPEVAISNIAKWLCSKTQIEVTDEACSELESTMVTSGPEVVRESIHRISQKPDLFGILTEPMKGNDALPWIVMLNAGAAYRIGPGRLHVQLARHFSALGYSCLRMDISGLGDSVVDSGKQENDTYAGTAMRDAAVVCDYLQGLAPGRPIVLMGLCSGAYAAFQSAAQFPHSALIESILLNPLTFFWKDGMTISASPTQRLQMWHYYKGIIFDANNWRQLFSGNLLSSLSGALMRFKQRVFPKTERTSNGSSPDARDLYSHPAKEDLAADLTRVVAASRKLAMVVSENDPGHFLLMHGARRKATQMIRDGQLDCFFIDGADHTFSNEAARKKLMKTLTVYLSKRYGSALPDS